jgi:hypothetical protein
MKDPNPKMLRATLFEVIDNQIRANDPPETRQTLDRLMKEGNTREESLKLIGCALVNEIYDVMKSETPFNAARYISNLKRLPELPWDDSQ